MIADSSRQSYGTSKWAGWVLEEQEAMKHFDAAWAMGINTFDTCVHSPSSSSL